MLPERWCLPSYLCISSSNSTKSIAYSGATLGTRSTECTPPPRLVESGVAVYSSHNFELRGWSSASQDDLPPLRFSFCSPPAWVARCSPLQMCETFCQGEGGDMFGLQFGRQCFCGDSRDTDIERHGMTECNTVCSGDETVTCGGRELPPERTRVDHGVRICCVPCCLVRRRPCAFSSCRAVPLRTIPTKCWHFRSL